MSQQFLAWNKQSILFIGRNSQNEELWLDKDQVTRHMFVSGSTGSGKTEFLLNLVSNSLLWGSGAVIVDGKGDIGFFAKLHAIATALNRQDDLLLVNFSQSNVKTDQGLITHTFNPFSILTADELCQIMSGMLTKNSYDGMWSERAISLMNVIIKYLVWRRDVKNEPMTVAKIEPLLQLDALLEGYDRFTSDPEATEEIKKEFKTYLETLPGYAPGKREQSSTVRDQHGYLSMQWTRTINLLSSSYGHILNEAVPDVDIRDVVLNRRILFVMLPSLERSSSEVANIGKIVVTMIKSMMGQVLRTPVEGTWTDTVANRATNAEYPFLVVMDELGQYLTDGMDTMAAQARSLNFGLVFATQDVDSMNSRNPTLSNAILANTNTKILMKAEYPKNFVTNQMYGLFEVNEDVFYNRKLTALREEYNRFRDSLLGARIMDEETRERHLKQAQDKILEVTNHANKFVKDDLAIS